MISSASSAYVVHATGLQTNEEKAEFGRQVQEWVRARVARHKYLRGGVLLIDVIPKRSEYQSLDICLDYAHYCIP